MLPVRPESRAGGIGAALVAGAATGPAAAGAAEPASPSPTLKLYIDGALVAQKADSTVAPSALTTHTMNFIGKSAYAGDALYQGGVSAFRVYNEELSAADTRLPHPGMPLPPPPSRRRTPSSP